MVKKQGEAWLDAWTDHDCPNRKWGEVARSEGPLRKNPRESDASKNDDEEIDALCERLNFDGGQV